MDFEPSEEQVMIGDSVDLFGTRHYPPAERIKQLSHGNEPVNERWRAMADLGWLGLGRPDDDGGTTAKDSYVLALMQGFGKHLMLEPYVTRCVLVPAVLETTFTDLGRRLLADVETGDTLAALAAGEPRGGFMLHWVETRAEMATAGFRLSGVKSHAEDGAEAEWFIVPARMAGAADSRDGISLFLVHRDAPGLSVERFRSIDDHRHARLRLDAVMVGEDALIGLPGQGLAVLEAAIDRAIAAHLAEALGSMDALRAITLDYLKTRHQFGKPIGAFQVLQHRMVDIDTACEEARSMVYHAAAQLRSAPAVRRKALSAAKARVGQCGLFVGRQAVQLHGGLGVSAELIVSHHLKRQMMLDAAYGNAAHHRAQFADLAA